MLLFDKMRNKKREEDHQEYEQVPETYREMVEKIEKGDFQEALRLAQMLKKQGADQEYWAMQMSIAYLGLGKTANAKSCIEPLYREYPDELTFSVQRAVCLYEDGEFFEAEKTLERIYPPDTYLPFYYSTYGDVLENQGKLEEAYEKYRVVIDEFQNEYDPGQELIDGVFQRLIELGMACDLDTVDQDMEEYLHFLSGADQTEELQKRVAENLILFAHYLETERYRPPFLRLADGLQKMEFMANPIYKGTLWSAYVALESYEINADSQVSPFTFDLITRATEVGTEEEQKIDRMLDQADEEGKTELLLMEYFAGKRMPGIQKELEHIRTQYPYSYEAVKELTEDLERNPKAASDKYLKLLQERTDSFGYTKSYFDRIYETHYGNGAETVLWDSEDGSYMRQGKKIGRNDPCPCGSGKKYKHCCGKK